MNHRRYGFLLIIIGTVLLYVHRYLGGSSFQDFLSGLLLGISVMTNLIGVILIARSLSKK